MPVKNSTVESSAPRDRKWSQDRRLRFIDFRLQWDGRINRADLRKFFGISVPQASLDINAYIALAPSNMVYDRSAKEYVAGPKFHSCFETSSPQQYTAQLLAVEQRALSEDMLIVGYRPPFAVVPVPGRTLSAETLAAVVRAIKVRSKLRVDYFSIARDEELTREISPHALGFDGLRWHARAFCHLRGRFADFVIGRISNIRDESASDIDPKEDVDWAREVKVVLAPHPSLGDIARKGVEADFGMKAGKVAVACRQAMLYYLLRRLNLADDGTPVAGSPQIVIANLKELAPSIAPPGQA
jgi:hypothetical protein